MVLALSVAASYSASAQGFGISDGSGSGTGISMDGGEKKAPKKKKSKKKKSDKKAAATPVGKAVGKLKTFNGKPTKKALVYVYLQSASWCGPCNQEMPDVVNAYK